jgi:hypothetical protein
VRQRIRSQMTYANVMATLAVFLVLGGGTALAAYVVSSNSQIGPGTVSGHKPPSGDHANIIANSINGTDIADRSGVDTCPPTLTVKRGPTCVGSDGVARGWLNAVRYCTGLGLRLPSLTEAVAMAKTYDVPGVDGTQFFWTEEHTYYTGFEGGSAVWAVSEAGDYELQSVANASHQTVCVTDPSA